MKIEFCAFYDDSYMLGLVGRGPKFFCNIDDVHTNNIDDFRNVLKTTEYIDELHINCHEDTHLIYNFLFKEKYDTTIDKLYIGSVLNVEQITKYFKKVNNILEIII